MVHNLISYKFVLIVTNPGATYLNNFNNPLSLATSSESAEGGMEQVHLHEMANGKTGVAP